jgi:hypothetical protein
MTGLGVPCLWFSLGLLYVGATTAGDTLTDGEVDRGLTLDAQQPIST